MKKILAIVSAAVLMVSGCGQGAVRESEKTKVTVILDWVPNTNHTGLYVAQDKGYFEEEGLEVDIIQPAEDTTLDVIGSDGAEFGISFQETVSAARTAARPLPVVAIAAVIQHNTSGFAAPVSKNIKTPKDFEGKKYGGWGTPIEEGFVRNAMERAGADSSKVTFITDSFTDFVSSVQRDIDFSWIYYGWAGIAAEEEGLEIDFLKLQDLNPDLDFYTPVIVTSENMTKENPETVKKFLRAVSKGYSDCIDDPEGSVQSLLKHAPETDADIALKSQKYLADEYRADATRWGEMKQEVWDDFGGFLFENNIIENELDAASAFTNEFLPQ